MKSSPSTAALADPFLLWSTLAMKTMEMSAAAIQVIAIRTGRLASAEFPPSEADQGELAMMGREKVDAFTRAGTEIVAGIAPAMADLGAQAFRSGMDVFNAATRLATSRSLPQTLARQRTLTDTLARHAPAAHESTNAAARLAHRALAPVHSTATANARRLTKS